MRMVKKGKVSAVEDESRVTILDFQRAFGVAPLPVAKAEPRPASE